MEKFYPILSRVLLCCLALPFLSGCGESDKKDMGAPGPVSDVTADSGFGRVTLRWKIPSDALYYYTKIEYVNPVTGETAYKYEDKFAAGADGYTETVIGGYSDEQERTYKLTAQGFTHGESEPVTVTCSPLEAAYNKVATTLRMEPDLDGGILSWNNDSGVPVIVRVQYDDSYGVRVTANYMADGNGAGRMRVGSVRDGSQDIRAWVLDETGANFSPAVDFAGFEADPAQLPAAIDRSVWTVAEVTNVWADNPNTDYSPENLIDDDLGSCWHTHPAVGGYPHHVVFDLGAPTVVSSVILHARNAMNQIEGPDVVGFETSEDGTTWYEAGTFAFNRHIWEAQEYHLQQVVHGARYLKLILVEGPANYSYMGEIYAFGKLR